jgi:hypothetical protein
MSTDHRRRVRAIPIGHPVVIHDPVKGWIYGLKLAAHLGSSSHCHVHDADGHCYLRLKSEVHLS